MLHTSAAAQAPPCVRNPSAVGTHPPRRVASRARPRRLSAWRPRRRTFTMLKRTSAMSGGRRSSGRRASCTAQSHCPRMSQRTCAVRCVSRRYAIAWRYSVKKSRLIAYYTLMLRPHVLSHGRVSRSTAVGCRRQGRKSDAILSCPGCLTTVCIDCQQHAVFENQFRAMYTMNCRCATLRRQLNRRMNQIEWCVACTGTFTRPRCSGAFGVHAVRCRASESGERLFI